MRIDCVRTRGVGCGPGDGVGGFGVVKSGYLLPE